MFLQRTSLFEHLNGFSTVSSLMCLHEKPLPHFAHLNGISAEWMGFQVLTWCWAALVTICAFEWLLSWVDLLMDFQVTWCWAAHLTRVTLKWHLSWQDWFGDTWEDPHNLCGSSHVSPNGFLLRNSYCHTLCTWMESLLSGSSHVPSSGQLLRRCCHTLSI